MFTRALLHFTGVDSLRNRAFSFHRHVVIFRSVHPPFCRRPGLKESKGAKRRACTACNHGIFSNVASMLTLPAVLTVIVRVQTLKPDFSMFIV
jgi:hypothetical protein